MKGLQLLATGGALPGRVVTNEDLSRQVDTSDEWITTRTGIRQRYYCTESEDAATLAIAAARQALMHPQADEFAKIVVEEGVKIVTTGAGNPGKYMAMWKAAGITVIPVVAAAILAKHLEPLGIDAVIAEGTESGGHVGEMTTMALVPQVVDAVHVPVIAAGGIADGRGLAAALALGACGVQVGTCLLASTECPIHENYKAALLKARDSDTIVTGRIGGTPVRVLKNRMSREYVRQEKAGADKMALERFTLGSLRKAVFDGDTENGSLMAGQAAGLLHEVRPVEEIFAAMVSEAKTCITGLCKETI